MRLEWPDHALLATLPVAHRCLSSAVLGGGLTSARHWLNLQVPHDYARTDPEAHLTEVARANALDPDDVIGMLTAADVRAGVRRDRGPASAVATVGIGQPLAAAGRRPRPLPRVGTINVLVSSPAAERRGARRRRPDRDRGQGPGAGRRRACARLNHHGPATGTATDAICVATPPGAGSPSPARPRRSARLSRTRSTARCCPARASTGARWPRGGAWR